MQISYTDNVDHKENNKMKIKSSLVAGALVVAGAALSVPTLVNAATTANSKLTQTITAGVLSTDIRDAAGAVVSAPVFPMASRAVSTSQQTTTGTFGDSAQRVTVDNPGGANNGWTLAWNATTPGTGTWTGGAGTYAYNGTVATGQLTVNPAAGTITPVTGGATGVTLGTSASFTGTTPITLVTAAAASADIWNGYLTGIGLSQTIPASQPAGSYTLDMTQTVTAS